VEVAREAAARVEELLQELLEFNNRRGLVVLFLVLLLAAVAIYLVATKFGA
jgi:hypothetical protein